MTDKQAFFDGLKDAAVAGWQAYQILPSIAMAQAAHESAFGTSELAEKANNYFGIKHKPDETGFAYFKKTWEHLDGKNVDVVAPFKWFRDAADGLNGYYAVFHGSAWRRNHYAGVIGETDYKKAAEALTGTYATDPAYKDKIIRTIEQYDLTKYDRLAGVTGPAEKGEPTLTNPLDIEIGLDIGHGEDTWPNNGKGVVRNGKAYEEHHFNSLVAKRMRELLLAHGFKVYMAQQPFSKEVELNQRIRQYNARGVDILFSVHANAGVASASGACAFYWHTSNKGKQLATRVRDSIKAKGYGTHGNGLHASKIGSWTNLAITRDSKMPAVLVEHGFMTNSHDFELIFGSKQAQYVEDMAQADVRAICEHFGVSFNGSAVKTAPRDVTPGSAEIIPAGNAYTVKKGDTLTSIAKAYGTTVAKLADHNGIKNANLIKPGQVIKIPSDVITYTVKKGDTLSEIAEDYGTTWKALADANGIANPNRIQPGQKLRIAKSGAAPKPKALGTGDRVQVAAGKLYVSGDAAKPSNNKTQTGYIERINSNWKNPYRLTRTKGGRDYIGFARKSDLTRK